MSVPYTRQFHYGDRGSDVEAVARALTRSRTKGNTKLAAFVLQPQRIRRTWGRRKQADLLRFKKTHGLVADSQYTKQAHEKLSPFFDSKARHLMVAYHPPPSGAEQHWAKLLAAMKALDRSTAGYLYGAGHATPLDHQRPSDHYDCSSSTSKVLREAGLFPHEYAWVSGRFASSYGQAGKGNFFTVYARDDHVWIRLHRSPWWRFDTSPHSSSDKRSGPRLRLLPRLTVGFHARHWPGM